MATAVRPQTENAGKLAQVFKLNERTLKLFRIGLRRRFPDLDEAAFQKVYLWMRVRCHNRNDLAARDLWQRILDEAESIVPPDDLGS